MANKVGDSEVATISVIMDKIFVSALLGISAFIASSISSLNEKVAVVISKISDHDRRLDVLELPNKGEKK